MQVRTGTPSALKVKSKRNSKKLASMSMRGSKKVLDASIVVDRILLHCDPKEWAARATGSGRGTVRLRRRGRGKKRSVNKVKSAGSEKMGMPDGNSNHKPASSAKRRPGGKSKAASSKQRLSQLPNATFLAFLICSLIKVSDFFALSPQWITD